MSLADWNDVFTHPATIPADQPELLGHIQRGEQRGGAVALVIGG